MGWEFYDSRGSKRTATVTNNAVYPALIPIYDSTEASATRSSITISNIPSGYEAVEVHFHGNKQTYAAGWIAFRVNGLSTTIYDQQYFLGQGASTNIAESGSQTSGLLCFGYGSTSSPATTAAQSFVAEFPNYGDASGNVGYKNCISRMHSDWGGGTNGAGGRFTGLTSTLIRTSAAISSLTIISLDGSNFEVGTRITVFVRGTIPSPSPGSAIPVTYATSLPAGPADGQEAILVDSLTAPTYQWRFRYNANSSSTYKWEFVGGAKLIVAASGTMTLPRAGDYDVAISGYLTPQSANPQSVTYTVTPSSGAVTGRNSISIQDSLSGGSGIAGDAAAQFRVTGVSAGATLTWGLSAGTGGLTAGVIMVTPARVS